MGKMLKFTKHLSTTSSKMTRMAFPSTLVLVATLLSIAFTSSSAQGLFNNNITLSGVITCPNTSLASVRTLRVIPQAKVDVVCGFFQSVSKSTTTDLFGTFSFGFTPSDVFFNNPELCRLRVTFPPGSCTFDRSNGSLSFPIIAIRNFGVLIAYVPGAPTLVLT